MSKRRKSRPVWLKFVIHETPPGASRGDVLDALREAIGSGELPDGYNVDLMWRNKEGADWRSGDYLTVLDESRAGGRGFDTLVHMYLDRIEATDRRDRG